MNHIYSIVRIAATHQTQVVPETARQRRGGSSGARVRGAKAAAVALVAIGAVSPALSGSGPALGAAGSCQEVGVFSVSDTRTTMCELTDNDHITVTSTGSITGATNAIQVGVPTLGFTPPVGIQVVNRGQLYGTTFEGIRNYGSIDLVDNYAGMRGNSFGIVNSNLIYVINNASTGTISGQNDGGILNYYGIGEVNNDGFIGGVAGGYGIENYGLFQTINNRGVISGPAGAINSPGDINILNNSGQLLGTVTTNNTELNLLGTVARISGALVNTGGSVNVLNGADFTTESTFSSATFGVNSGGTLRVGSSAHTLTVSSAAANAFSNAGTLRVGEGVVANVVGNYTQSGAVRLGASSVGSFGRVAVQGNAALTSTATFFVDVNAVNTLADGQVLAGVVSATGTLTNSASTNNVSDSSALFNFTSVTNGNAVDLRVAAAGFPGGSGDGIVPAVIQNGLNTGVPIATVLDGYVRGGTTGTDWDAVVTALGQLPTNRDVAAAVGQMMPSLHANAGLALLLHGASTGTAIEQQRELTGQSGGSEAGGRSLWVKPIGGWVQQDAVDGVSGYKMGTTGIVGGVQRDLNAGTRLGFGLGYLKSTVDGQDFAGSHRSGIESAQLIGYGRYALDNTGWQFDWQGDYTLSRIESQRGMGFIGRTARAKYDGDAWHLGVGVSRAYQVSQMSVKPLVALDWRQFRSDGYTEDGAGALNLQVNSQKVRELILKVGAQVQGDINARTQWLTRAAVGYDLNDQRSAVTGRFTGGGVAFTTEGLPKARTVAELGVGVRYRATEGMELTARYDVRLRKGLRDQTATVRLAWAF
ncbi:MAG: autotransporter domain-containing protein [Hydrogenophaga sp.]|uniref:autotransporter domain-containing protein n=1 Tax=Hydrogenophaga sp. TaxID=1904254 RepID=UPI0040353A30